MTSPFHRIFFPLHPCKVLPARYPHFHPNFALSISYHRRCHHFTSFHSRHIPSSNLPPHYHHSSPSRFSRFVFSPKFYHYSAAFGAFAAIFYLINLETVPETNRRRFNIVSPSLERLYSDHVLNHLLQEYRHLILPDTDRRVRLIRKILFRLTPSVNLPNLDWQVYLINSNQANAFVAPGGKVFVFTGIFSLCTTEDSLAAVLSHEIAHTLAKHSAERLSLAWPLLALNFFVSTLLGLPFAIGNTLLNYAILMPGSRLQESEADYIGLLIMASSCYDPRAALHFWSRMSQLSRDNPPEFFSTHPTHHARLHQISRWMDQALQRREQAGCTNENWYRTYY